MVSKCFKKYIVEFLGTYFLVLTIGCMINLETDKTLAPIIIGLVLAVMVYAGGKISGGHYNPAVSLAVYLNALLVVVVTVVPLLSVIFPVGIAVSR